HRQRIGRHVEDDRGNEEGPCAAEAAGLPEVHVRAAAWAECALRVGGTRYQAAGMARHEAEARRRGHSAAPSPAVALAHRSRGSKFASIAARTSISAANDQSATPA